MDREPEEHTVALDELKFIGIRRSAAVVLPPEVTGRENVGQARLIAMVIDGVHLNVERLQVMVALCGDPEQLGSMAGLVRAEVDKLGEWASAQFGSAYHEAYAGGSGTSRWRR